MRHQPGELVDRYEILGSLGEGAYAETYKARDTSSGTTVVLKMPNPNLFADPGLFQRYPGGQQVRLFVPARRDLVRAGDLGEVTGQERPDPLGDDPW